MKIIRYLAIVVATATACSPTDHATPESDPDTSAATTVVDSILPLEEEIRRFKAALDDTPVESLEGGAASRDRLVRNLIEAIENNDTTAIRRMMISPAEFIDIYYPASRYARPPYRQSPAFVWYQIRQNSEKGIGRVLQRFGGRPTNYSGYECDEEELSVRNGSRLWDRCVVHWNPNARTAGTLSLFGTIIERNGRYKFVSYTNGL